MLLAFSRCSSPAPETPRKTPACRQLPRILFITTGIGDEKTQLAPGIVIAIQSFNALGATVRLEPRDILYHFDELCTYNIIILSAFNGYHDADRKNSLTYMSDEEIHNLSRFNKAGGVLISSVNIGRNYPDGTDRVNVFQTLTKDNWELATCYGVSLSERNMTGYGLAGKIPGYLDWKTPAGLLTGEEEELWTLVPDKPPAKSVRIWGNWANPYDSLPGMTMNRNDKGTTWLLAYSGFLHPINDGGFWSEEQIRQFYRLVFDTYNKDNNIRFTLNPWPDGHDVAFCASLNAEGTRQQFERIFALLDKEKIRPTVFVNGLLSSELKDFLNASGYPLASNGFSYSNYEDFGYPGAVDDILRNENFWETDFTGFRFPFTRPKFWGLLALDEHAYAFESSIGANNIDFFYGSVVPYNLVIAESGFYKSTDMLEIAPTYHDDYYFLKSIREDPAFDSLKLEQDILVYAKYLENYWNYAVKPYKGMMVFLGHPQFTGYNASTLSALGSLIKIIRRDDPWITTLDDAAGFRKKLSQTRFSAQGDQDVQRVTITAPEEVYVEKTTLNFDGMISAASAIKGKVKVLKREKGSQIVFDAFNGQVITLKCN
jgi:hypothetical protein